MPRLEFTTIIDASREAVWAFYDNVQTLPRITPPTTRVQIIDPPKQMHEGSRFVLIVCQPPLFIPITWETIITAHRPPSLFIDEQGKGPFSFWRQEHLFEDMEDGRTRMRDSITYRPPLGVLGIIADYVFIRPMLGAMFAYRHRKTHEALDQQTPLPRIDANGNRAL